MLVSAACSDLFTTSFTCLIGLELCDPLIDDGMVTDNGMRLMGSLDVGRSGLIGRHLDRLIGLVVDSVDGVIVGFFWFHVGSGRDSM